MIKLLTFIYTAGMVIHIWKNKPEGFELYVLTGILIIIITLDDICKTLKKQEK